MKITNPTNIPGTRPIDRKSENLEDTKVNIRALEDTDLAMPVAPGDILEPSNENPIPELLSPAELEGIRAEPGGSLLDRGTEFARYQVKLYGVVSATMVKLDLWTSTEKEITAAKEAKILRALEAQGKLQNSPTKAQLEKIFDLHTENVFNELCRFFGLTTDPVQLMSLRLRESPWIFIQLLAKAHNLPETTPPDNILGTYGDRVKRFYQRQLIEILDLPPDATSDLVKTKFVFFRRNPAQLQNWGLDGLRTPNEIKRTFKQKVRSLAERFYRLEILRSCFPANSASV